MTGKEYLICGLEGILMVGVFGYFFYRSIAITVLALPLSFFFIRYKEHELCEEKKFVLQMQFKDVLISVNNAIKAGYSLENAFIDSFNDMAMFYGEDSAIIKELHIIINGLKNNISLTVLITEFGNRSDIQDIKDFASVLSIGKQTGGNIGEILDSYIRVAEERVGVLEDINTIISSQKYEQRIMNIVPFFIIFYIELTSKGFFDCLYSGLSGRIIMTICLLVYILSVYLSSRIIRISI